MRADLFSVTEQFRETEHLAQRSSEAAMRGAAMLLRQSVLQRHVRRRWMGRNTLA